jgi:hypothetical protein
MNGQMPVKREWKDIVEEIKTAIHNSQIQLELLKAQLHEAEVHTRGT